MNSKQRMKRKNLPKNDFKLTIMICSAMGVIEGASDRIP
jgi:hypothetical protein